MGRQNLKQNKSSRSMLLAKLRYVPRRPTCRKKSLGLAVELLESRLVPSAISLGTASAFNVIVLHDMNASNSETEGRIAVGGNADLSTYGVGSKLPSSAGSRDDLIVGGNLQFHNGQIHAGNAVYQGLADVSGLGIPDGTIRQGSAIDFGASEAEMSAKSASWAAMPANGPATVNYGSLSLFGADPSLNVFSVSAADLATGNNLVIDSPAGSDVLVNVSGASAALHNFTTTVLHTDKAHVFFNFFNATSIDIHSIAVQGNLLAPNANVSFANGSFDGTLVAHSLTATGPFHLVAPYSVPSDPGSPPMTPGSVTCTTDALGIATDFNVFVFEDHHASFSEVAGRVAVGGNATYNGYGIGQQLSNSHGGRDDLIVGGNLSFTNGQVSKGNIVYGGTADLTRVGVRNGTVRQDSVIDFGDIEADLTQASADFASISANGTVANSYGQYILTGADPDLNVFNMSAAQLAAASQLRINSPADSTVLVNISGSSAQLNNLSFKVSGTDKAHVLYNFYQAGSVQISGVSVRGSVLAPLANVVFNNGDIEGTVVAQSLSGNGAIHNVRPELHVCVTPLGSLSGYVYFDANNNGAVDSGELGITGLTMALTGIDDLGANVSLSTTTDLFGAYSFVDLRPGTYSITETQPANYLDGKDAVGTEGGTANNDQIASIVLNAGVNGTANNFGELAPAALSGSVFSDTNNNGMHDGMESGISGATVTLSGTDDLGASVSLPALTDSSGAYRFVDLRPGNYTITETQPAGYVDGIDMIGTQGGTTNNDQFTDIDLSSGEDGTANNFGETVPASLAGFVYVDANDNALKEAIELGIAGVTVSLTGNDLHGIPVNLTTVTDSAGAYYFGSLQASDAAGYTLTETQPTRHPDGQDTIGSPGGVTGNDQFSSIVLYPGVVGANNNFGEGIPYSSLAGFAYVDLNNNGVRESGEAALAGVTVTLSGFDYITFNSVFMTTTTDAGGAYLFSSLRRGQYNLIETVPAGYLQGLGAVGSQGGSAFGNFIRVDYLDSGVDGVNNNFGSLANGLSGAVYVDANNDGIRQGGESGLSAVTITLSGNDNLGGSVSQSTTTDGNGAYLFYNLAPSDANGYTLTESQPAAYTDGQDVVGTLGGVAGNDAITNIVLAANTSGTGYNFGEQVPRSSLAGFTYIDSNNNGVKESGESGLAGVTITLSGFDYATFSSVYQTTTTDADGAYSFGNLLRGQYNLIESTPSAYLQGIGTVGSQGGSAFGNFIRVDYLDSGVNGVNNNFGVLANGLTGAVYLDANNDGVRQGGESGLSAVTITLTGTDHLGGTVSQTTTTDGNGVFLFYNLPPSDAAGYTLTETQPAAYADGLDSAGSLGGAAGNDTIANIVLAANTSGAGYNFGELVPPSSLSGFVYADIDNDHMRTSGEAGIAGVTVTLSGFEYSTFNSIFLTTTTDADGAYHFDNLQRGQYNITETHPAGYLPGAGSVGSQGGSAFGNFIRVDYLDTGVNGINNNFGELPPARLSGFVYHDADDNGLKGSGETVIAGVNVLLSGIDDLGNTISLSTTTDANGAYSFGNLRPSNATGYTISEIQPGGYTDGQDTIGTQGGNVFNDLFASILLLPGIDGVDNNFGER